MVMPMKDPLWLVDLRDRPDTWLTAFNWPCGANDQDGGDALATLLIGRRDAAAGMAAPIIIIVTDWWHIVEIY